MAVSPDYSAELLAPGGLFERRWPDFYARPGQQQMAALVETAMDANQDLVIEAASGSGKTVAYLTPIIAKGQKAIISTASRYLQQQLFRQDIPRIKKILDRHLSVALLQGRSHYLCPYYLDKNLQADGSLGKQHHGILAHLAQRFRQTGIGDLDLLAPDLPNNLRRYVTSSRDDCLARQCPQYSRCPLMIARQKAQAADLVVVNHSVLFSDTVMRREQLGDLLPQADVVVVDEAHRLVDFAQTILGQRLSSRKLKQFLNDATHAVRTFAPEQRQLIQFITQIETGLTNLAQHIPPLEPYRREQHSQLIDQLIAAFDRLRKNLLPFKDRHQHLADLLVRCQLLIEKLRTINNPEDLCCVEGDQHSFMLQCIPAHLTAALTSVFSEASGSWVFTSATLSVAGSAQRFLNSLGLAEEIFNRVDSAIDYQQQAILYTPELSVEPDHQSYCSQLLQHLIPLLQLVNGRVLCLFTSYRSLNAAAQGLTGNIEYPLFIQNTSLEHSAGDNYRLIERFKAVPKGVLLGTGSFWEGLDLSGVPLAAVVIDRLPFAPPNDPLIQLRAADLENHGVNSFEQSMLPDAVIRLRQGCGRLLRRISDRGVIMVADSRLHNRSYGEVFIDSLPAMEQVNSLESLQPFLNHSSTTATAINSEKP